MIAIARRPWGLLLCLALAGCADVPSPTATAETLFADAAFAPPSEPVAPADVFRISPAMREYLASRVAEEVDKHGEARGLIDALSQDSRLQIDYDAEFTRNAAQAFDARAGNCLSLAIVTGALAKELGLDVRYQSVRTGDHWERDGDLLELVGHVNVTVGMPIPRIRSWGFNADRWTVDFLSPADRRRFVAQPITESRVIAMFMNNRAAEALAHGRTDDAYWWVRGAVASDPTYASLYNTLGVTYLRKGLPERAEAALRVALAQEPRNTETWENLAIVLRREGRPEQAAAIEQEHPRSGAAVLAAALAGGKRANEVGDYARALALYRAALRTSADNHELHYQLAVTYLNMGQRRLAMEQLEEAKDDSTSARQRSVYASKVDLLKSATSSFRLDPNVLRTN